ncbi:MAG: hypothetical protein R6U61_03555 [Thermoplasmata archaeon]
MNKITLKILPVFIILLTVSSVIVSGTYYDVHTKNQDIHVSDWEHLEFTITSDASGSYMVTDVTYIDGEDSYKIFSEITISGSWGYIPSEFDVGDDNLKYISSDYNLYLRDSDTSFLEIQGVVKSELEVKFELGDDVTLDKWGDLDYLTLSINEKIQLRIDFTGAIDVSVENHAEEPDTINFVMNTGGHLKCSIEEKQIQVPAGKILSEISLDGKGGLGWEKAKGLSVERLRANRGDIKFKVTGDYSESKILHFNLDRELIGSDIEDIKVKVDGEDIEHKKVKDIYSQNEAGYYVNVTKDSTHVYVRMDFSEHTVNIYEESAGSVEEVDEGITPFDMLGVLIGIVIVIAAAGVLFYKRY